MVKDDADPPAERSALRQPKRQPRAREAQLRGDDRQIDVPDVVRARGLYDSFRAFRFRAAHGPGARRLVLHIWPTVVMASRASTSAIFSGIEHRTERVLREIALSIWRIMEYASFRWLYSGS